MKDNNLVSDMTRKYNYIGGWSGILYVLLAMVGWWFLAGYWPMIGPSAGAEEVSAFYQNDNLLGKRIGLILLMWSAVFMLIFTSATSNHISRIEGRSGPLTYGMLLGGFATAMLTFYPALWWLTAAFRPDTRPEELTFLLNDIGWLQFIGGVSLVVTMYISVAIASFIDASETPTFPRWSGFASIWVFVLLIPGQLLFMFKTGPFAWNGLLAFWVPGGVFLGWFILIGILLIKASSREKLSLQ